MPFSIASPSSPQAQVEFDPSSTGNPSAANVARPSSVLQRFALSFVTCGTTEMSAYSALPLESAASVFTHGMPWLRWRMS